MALRAAGRASHPRVREAVRLLCDRALDEGGWNYGNTRVFANTLQPFPATTGIALTALAGERPLVSAVFHNRLRIGMKLDCDPTVAYALKRAGRYTGRLLIRDLRFESPYNTYLHAGLPPGPISNPGLASLDAALHPAAEKFLYFVARGDGGHQFSRTLGEHLEAVRRFRELKKR